ncbi:hypothetical protein APHAL10511_005800 [Amanita phalloides]|nr:hypothetical protein APHAL10511_005800 [Amanita phalloides]
MLLAHKAWGQVKALTIKNCWSHTKIQGEILDHDIYNTSSLHSDHGAWDILQNFATSGMTLPTAEDQLKNYLGNQYNAQDWQPALNVVMNVEGNIMKAQEVLVQLSSTTQLP